MHIDGHTHYRLAPHCLVYTFLQPNQFSTLLKKKKEENTDIHTGATVKMKADSQLKLRVSNRKIKETIYLFLLTISQLYVLICNI